MLMTFGGTGGAKAGRGTEEFEIDCIGAVCFPGRAEK